MRVIFLLRFKLSHSKLRRDWPASLKDQFYRQDFTQPKRSIYLNDSDKPANTLTNSEINTEIEAAKLFSPKLDRYIISTTGQRDAKLQEYVRLENESKRHKFKIALLFWDDYVEFLNSNPKMMYKYYENVLKFREQYSPKQHYLLLISMAFDRPALRTPFHCESRAVDFISAISATQNALSTGRLIDREGKIIDECRVPAEKMKEIEKVKILLQKVRNIAAEALSNGTIIEHPTVIEIRDHLIVNELNELRKNAIDLLNDLLVKNNIEKIPFDGL